MTKRDSKFKQSQKLVADIWPLLGSDRNVTGFALAQLMAAWLGSFQMDDEKATNEAQGAQLANVLQIIIELMPHQNAKIRKMVS